MKSGFSHIQFVVDPANIPFYRDMFAILGWAPLHDSEDYLGVAGTNGVSLWFGAGPHMDVANDYDGIGANHIALAAESIADVDAFASYLAEKGVPALFETPRHRPDFGMGEGQTYYQVMFTSPDNILWEFVYIGPHES
ncbi:MAG: VOC family protein [Thermomicrobiales bacterium]